MMKTPRGENARLISNVHLEHETRKFYNKFIRFSLDIFESVRYSSNWQVFKERGLA